MILTITKHIILMTVYERGILLVYYTVYYMIPPLIKHIIVMTL